MGTNYKSWEQIINSAHGIEIVGADYNSWERIINRGNELYIVGTE